MNLTPYVFVWKSGGEVFPYPKDYAANIFSRVYEVELDDYYDSALIIRREEQAVYYIYIRQLSCGEGVGLCCITTYSYIPDLKALIKAFDNTIKRMCKFGCLICKSDYRIILTSAWYSPKAKGLSQTDAESALEFINVWVGKLDIKSDLPPISLEADSFMVYYLDKSALKGFDRSRLYSSGTWIITLHSNYGYRNNLDTDVIKEHER